MHAWRDELLRFVLRGMVGMGALVYLPSVFFAMRDQMAGVVVLDTVALGLVVGLAYAPRLSPRTRALAPSLVFYLLGVGLLIGVGAIGQVFLVGFSVMTTLLLGVRWGLRSVVLATVSMVVIGWVGIAHPEMVLPQWNRHFYGWLIITANYVLVTTTMVLALGTVVSALENALSRAGKVNADLAESRALLAIAGQTARLGGWRVHVLGTHVEWSDECCELHEMPLGSKPTVDEALGFQVPEFRSEVRAAVERCGREGIAFDKEGAIVTAKGNHRWIRLIGRPLRSARGNITHIHGSMQDVNERKLGEQRSAALEDQLRQAQRMETVGRLAGGVADAVNTLL